LSVKIDPQNQNLIIIPNNKSADVILRSVKKEDFEIYFDQQQNPEANYMAAFTSKDPSDKIAFNEKWKKIKADKSITINTIIYKKKIAGYIVCHSWFGEPEISYWIGKEFWGKGIASAALIKFLTLLEVRPLYARVVNDNIASIRVLEKCGFVYHGKDKGFANARDKEVEEFIYKLS